MLQQNKGGPHHTDEGKAIQTASDEVVDIKLADESIQFFYEYMVVAILHYIEFVC